MDYTDSERREVIPFIPRGSRVLDVGCWKGAFAARLKAEDPAATVWGVEARPEAAAVAGQRLDRVIEGTFPEVVQTDLTTHKFDCITFLDVLEHMVDPWTSVRVAKGLLAPGGVCVASIPNVRNLKVLSPLLRGRWDYRDWGILDRTHLRFFTRATMVQMFDEAGFSIRRVEPVNFVTSGRIARVLRMFGKRTAEFRAMQYVIVAAPRT